MPAVSAPESGAPKKYSMKQILWNSVAIGLAAVLIVLLARAADWRSVIEQLRHARLWLLMFAWIVLGSSACFLRAVRWYLLLSAESRLGFWPVFWANSSGNFANSVLPARAGEFIRAAMVSMKSGLSKRFVLAIALCERVFDLLVLVTLTRIGLSYVSNIPVAMQRAINIAFWGAICAVTFLVVVAQSRKWVDLATNSEQRSPAGVGRFWSRLQPFVHGIHAIHDRQRLVLFFVLTIPIWLVDAWGARLVAASLGLNLPLPVALILLAALGCSSLLPTTPGQLGVFQFVTIRVVAMAQIIYNQALTFSLILQAGNYITLGIWGIPGLWMYKKSRSMPGIPPSVPAATTEDAHELVRD